MRCVNLSPYRPIVAAMRAISVASNPRPIMVTLPKPNDAFRWVQLGGGWALTCDALVSVADHFYSSRSWQLGARTTGSENGWLEIARAMRVETEHFGRLHQVHGCTAVTYKNGQIPGG